MSYIPLPINVISTIANLRLCTVTSLPASSLFLEGYYLPGDGGGGNFVYVATDTTSSDDSGTIIVDASSRRWYRTTGKERFSISWFGGSTSSSDNTAALNAALAALPSTGGEIFFGAGTWTFTSEIIFTYPTGPCSLSFIGSGAANCVLFWPSTSGILLAASNAKHSFHFIDMTIRTNASSATGITLTQSSTLGNCDQSDFTRVTFDASGSQYWACAINILGWSFINFIGILVYGNGASTGVNLEGNTAVSPYYGIVYNFSCCGFFSTEYGITYNSYIQGVTVSQCNFTNGAVGIYVPNTVTGVLAQLNVSTSQFGVTSVSILANGPINELMISNNLVIQPPNTVAIKINAPSSFNTFNGNTFTAESTTGTIGILFSAAVSASVITGNIFQGWGTGIYLETATNQTNVQANVYPNTITPITNASSGNSIGVSTT